MQEVLKTHGSCIQGAAMLLLVSFWPWLSMIFHAAKDDLPIFIIIIIIIIIIIQISIVLTLALKRSRK
jgi:tetrahydromethanopterin S-methyltransferase subunit E